VGRTLQSIAGVGTWVIGFALLAQNEDKSNLGKSMGLAMSSVTAGMVGGPSVSGTLLQLFGYWTAWSVPLIVLALDIAARLIMIEPPSVIAAKDTSPSKPSGLPMPKESEGAGETTGLLSHTPSVNRADAYGIRKDTKTRDGYYKAMLTDTRVLGALTNVLVVAILVSGMNNTLPVHLEQTFAWKTLLIGMMFFCLQVPNILFSYPAGWLRDRIGIRGPATFGWIAMIPPILLLGTPGDAQFPWAGSDAAGQAIFICSLILFGSVLPLVRGVGAVQLGCKWFELFHDHGYFACLQIFSQML
jgi:MFS family permease